MTTIMQSNTEDTEEALSSLAAALRPFRELGTSSFPVSIVLTFLLVAKRQDRTVGELAKAAGISLGTMSRQLADLGQTNRYGSPGLGLIEQRAELADRRYMRHRLTPKGHALVRQVAGAVQNRRAVAVAA
jgi:DNA-binding MarR family transcriptional regulator